MSLCYVIMLDIYICNNTRFSVRRPPFRMLSVRSLGRRSRLKGEDMWVIHRCIRCVLALGEFQVLYICNYATYFYLLN